MPYVSFKIPASAIYSEYELAEMQSSPRKKIKDITVRGEQIFYDHDTHPTIGFHADNLLPGAHSIHHYANASTWLATFTNMIIIFEFNEAYFKAYPHQKPGEVVKMYQYNFLDKAYKVLMEEHTRLQDEHTALILDMAGEDL